MSSAVDGDESPYIGPRPFERGDRTFFGRDREVRELVSLVVAHRIVVLHAASGAGKTSLLNAGLIPVLEREESFEVLPIARLRPLDPAVATRPEVRNVYTFGLTSNWSREPDGTHDDDVVSLSLAAALARREHPTDADGFASPRAVVFDQFEELFSLFPERWPERPEFLQDVADALEQDPLLRVVFALREDYLAQLDAHAALLPGNLRTRLRIERLRADAAQQAITRPLVGTRRAFAPGVAEKLVSDLRTVRVDRALGDVVEVAGEFVEPVHLQVACQSLWAELPAQVTAITEDHLRAFGNVDEVLARFYEDAVRDAASAAAIKESRLRESLEAAFLTAGGTRGTVYRGASSTAGIPNRAIDELENRHLLRAEWRAGARWYELTHDRLVEPIQASNRAFRGALARRRNRRVLGAAAVVAVLSVVVVTATLSDTLSGGPDSPAGGPVSAVPLRAELGSVALTRHVSLSEYLSRGVPRGPGLTDRQLQRDGVLTTYDVRLKGLRGKRVVLEAVIKNDRDQNVSRVDRAVFVPSTDDSVFPGDSWLATPRSAGRYRVRLELLQSGTSLDIARTGAFAGIAGEGRRLSSTLRVFVVGTGRGLVRSSPSGLRCPSACTITVPRGTRLTLTAFPGSGSTFAGWTAPCRPIPTCVVIAGTQPSIRARFEAR